MTEAAAVPAVDLPGGVQMPMLGFGTWLLRGKAGREAIRAALGAGWPVPLQNDLVGTLQNRGNAKQQGGDRRSDRIEAHAETILGLLEATRRVRPPQSASSAHAILK